MKHVLYVCVENSCRSQLAEALTNLYAGDKLKAYSAGSKPSGMVNPKAITSMREMNYDLSAHLSKSLQDIPVIEYDYAITMGCGDECPYVNAKHREDWAIPDPKHMSEDEFREIRNQIEDKVKGLLEKLF